MQGLRAKFAWQEISAKTSCILIDDLPRLSQKSAMSNNSINQLKRAVQLAEQIDKLEAELNQVLANAGGKVSNNAPATSKVAKAPKASKPARKKGGMSAEGRARIVAAQKARWAKIKAAKGSAAPAKAAAAPKGKGRRKISPEARARMVAGVKARWARIRAAKAAALKKSR